MSQTNSKSFARRTLTLMLVSVAGSHICASAQTTSFDPLNTSPRGLTDLPTSSQPASTDAAAARNADRRVGTEPGTPKAPAERLVLPPDPAQATKPIVFGSQIFTGRFAAQPLSSFNPEHQMAVGDRINLRMWGAFTFDAVQVVDVHGNIFVPNVGPVSVRGVRNADLNRQIAAQVQRIFKSNVGVYATLAASQPVKIYVTGFVRAPGLYGGLSSDSVLHYLDLAGGIDPDRGSYLEVDVLRAGQVRAKFNLYQFLLDGRIDHVQLQDGDTVIAHPRKYTVQVGGQVENPYVFEFGDSQVPASRILSVARPKADATHLSIVRRTGAQRRSEYHPLSAASSVVIENGDEVTVTSDKYPGTILVRIDGAHLGERVLVLPYGARLRDAMTSLRPAPQANPEAAQLFRRSVAARQKELLESSLRSLETYALTARSATSEESALRTREGEQILKFVERARNVQARGQVVLANREQALDTLLEDGDVIQVPERSNIVLVSGEVLFPNAVVFDARATTDDYVNRAGGYNQGADKARLVVLRQDGRIEQSKDVDLQPGDEIMVLPKIETKNVELARGLTQIIYQIAVSAKVLFGL